MIYKADLDKSYEHAWIIDTLHTEIQPNFYWLTKETTFLST